MESLFSESDWDSFSESSEEMDLLYGGNALSLLSNLEESISKIDDFLSLERGFLHGDIVCSVTDPSGQMGRVVGLDMLVDLQSTKGKVVRDVNSKKIVKIRSITIGDYIVYGHWVGRVEKVVDSVTVIFDDGARNDFCLVDPEKLVPISPNLVDDPQYPYYPGQRVQIRPSTASRSARWLCGSWKAGREEGTIHSVKAGLVHVEWLASALMGWDVHLPQPPKLIEGNRVALLSSLCHANWQLGDWCMLAVDHNDVDNKHDLFVGFDQMNKNSATSEIFIITKTKRKVDVAWQDGSHTFGIESQSLLPVNIVDVHEFWPQQFVLRKRSCEHIGSPLSQKWGFVRAMDTKEKTAKVFWRNASTENSNGFVPEQYEEIVSAYELMEHPDYSFFLGEVVFKLIQNQTETQNAEAASIESEKAGGTLNRDLDDFYLSCIGNVIGFKDGAVEVKWANGPQAKVSPSEIIRLENYEASTASPVPIRGNAEQLNQQMVDHEMDSSDRKRNDLHGSANMDEVRGKDTSFSVSRYTMGFLSGVASSLFGTFCSSSGLNLQQSIPTFDGRDESPGSHDNSLIEGCEPFVDSETLRDNEDQSSVMETKINSEVEVMDDHCNKGIENLSLSKGPKRFKQFDMVTDCSDHHFFNSAGKGLETSQVKRAWLRKIQQEWSILEKNLPDSIHVRGYEERMDLLRAAIVGPAGTPYHDGLFFFDIFLPSDYPNEPPMVHYHSGGLRLNPNLYESGKVCLSLLNTWAGSSSEVWKPKSSTVLQVLISLQALVLNDKPYFNEAGYDKQMGKTEGEKNSVSYNENAFLLTCQSMLYTLRKPPKHFEALVEEHFSDRCSNILLTCKDYIEGAPVGFSSGLGGMEPENNHKGCSTGFKIMLAKLQTKLVEAFVEKGIDCSQFLEP